MKAYRSKDDLKINFEEKELEFLTIQRKLYRLTRNNLNLKKKMRNLRTKWYKQNQVIELLKKDTEQLLEAGSLVEKENDQLCLDVQKLECKNKGLLEVHENLENIIENNSILKLKHEKTIDKLMKQNDALVKENEKLKEDLEQRKDEILIMNAVREIDNLDPIKVPKDQNIP